MAEQRRYGESSDEPGPRPRPPARAPDSGVEREEFTDPRPNFGNGAPPGCVLEPGKDGARTDADIAAEARARLAAARLPGLEIAVRHGIVVLEGEVEDRPAALHAAKVCGAIPGVTGIDDRLRLRRAPFA